MVKNNESTTRHSNRSYRGYGINYSQRKGSKAAEMIVEAGLHEKAQVVREGEI